MTQLNFGFEVSVMAVTAAEVEKFKLVRNAEQEALVALGEIVKVLGSKVSDKDSAVYRSLKRFYQANV